MTAQLCVRCGQPVEDGRQKYCSDACADSAMRAIRKARKNIAIQGLANFRVYDYRGTPQ